jgi:RNA polymerase sigma-70 factor, ECF subfamily
MAIRDVAMFAACRRAPGARLQPENEQMRQKPHPAALERLADEDLMTLVDRKDPDAFEVFYDRHGGAAYSLAHRIVGDRGVAEDVTQEAFLSIWRSKARFDPARGSVRSWALGIARNRAIDALRHSARPVPKLDFDDEVVLEAQPAGERTEAEAIRRDTAGRLRQALGLLPRDQSQVIELAYFGGFSHREIADMVGAPLGTIKGRMRLGLEKIRATLAEGIPEDDVPGAYL